MLNALQWEVMNATADDWESLEQILPQVVRFCGPTDRSLIAETVVELLRDGLMEEMHHPDLIAAEILRDPIEYWFRMTLRGRELWDTEGHTYRSEDEPNM